MTSTLAPPLCPPTGEPGRIHLNSALRWFLPANTIILPAYRRWGCPFALCAGLPNQPGHRGAHNRADAVARYQQHVDGLGDGFRRAVRRQFGGMHLACRCDLALPCHADLLLAIANQPEPDKAEGRDSMATYTATITTDERGLLTDASTLTVGDTTIAIPATVPPPWGRLAPARIAAAAATLGLRPVGRYTHLGGNITIVELTGEPVAAGGAA
jgi:hypothetical protein